MISRAKLCRASGIAMLAIWVFLCTQPVSAYVVEGAGLRRAEITPDMLTYEYGWQRALFGWIAALNDPPNIARLANPLGLWCLVDLLNRRRPNVFASFIAAGLALGGLESHSLGDFRSHGMNSESIMYYTVDAWMLSCAIPIMVNALIYAFLLPPSLVGTTQNGPGNPS